MADIRLKRWDGGQWISYDVKTKVSQVTGLQDALDAKVDESREGVANGIATLDGNSQVPISQLPSTAISGMELVDLIVSEQDFEDFVNSADRTNGTTVGNYVIVSNSATGGDISLDLSSASTPVAYFKDPQGGLIEQLTVQSGDWIIETGFVIDTGSTTCVWNETGDEYLSATGTQSNPCSDGATKTVCYDAGNGQYMCQDYTATETTTSEPYFVYGVIDNNQSDRYFSKSGGVLGGNLNMADHNISRVSDIEADTVTISANTNKVLTTNASSELTFGGVKVLTTSDEGSIDAGTLDGEDGTFYRNASNINTGTLSDARLPNSISSDITGNAATANAFSGSKTITFTGDATGSTSTTFSTNPSIELTVTNNSHSHNGDTVHYTGSGLTHAGVPFDADLNSAFGDVDTALSGKITSFSGSGATIDGIVEGDILFDTDN